MQSKKKKEKQWYKLHNFIASQWVSKKIKYTIYLYLQHTFKFGVSAHHQLIKKRKKREQMSSGPQPFTRRNSELDTRHSKGGSRDPKVWVPFRGKHPPPSTHKTPPCTFVTRDLLSLLHSHLHLLVSFWNLPFDV